MPVRNKHPCRSQQRPCIFVLLLPVLAFSRKGRPEPLHLITSNYAAHRLYHVIEFFSSSMFNSRSERLIISFAKVYYRVNQLPLSKLLGNAETACGNRINVVTDMVHVCQAGKDWE